MEQQEKVVVVVKPDVYTHKNDNRFVMRFDDLGLTAYGNSVNEAREVLFSMFRVLIDELRSRGILAKRLNKLDVEWYYASEFDGDWSDVTDVSDSPMMVEAGYVKSLAEINLLAESSSYQAVSMPLAAAA